MGSGGHGGRPFAGMAHGMGSMLVRRSGRNSSVIIRLRIGIFLIAVFLLSALFLCVRGMDGRMGNIGVACGRSTTNCRRSRVVPLTRLLRVLEGITGIVCRVLFVLLLVTTILVVVMTRILTL